MLVIFLDIETTGLNPHKHRPIDIAFRIIDLSCHEVCVSYQSLIKISSDDWAQSDLKSLEINGYTWEEIEQGKCPDDVAEQIIGIFSDVGVKRGEAVFICQNPAFDRIFLTHLISPERQETLHWPYHWLDLASMYWAFQVKNFQHNGETFPKELCLSKNAIAKACQLPEELNPHKALNGVDHLILCYQEVLEIDPVYINSETFIHAS